MSPRWSSYVAPNSPKGVWKTQNGRFALKKVGLRLKKVCYKVYLCENCQRQSCNSFIGLTNRAKIIGGRRPLVPEILSQWPRWSEIWTTAIAPKRYEIGCQLLLITNRKSHTGFRLVPTSMTLNDLERRNSPYFAFSHGIRQIFRPIISQWIEDRPIMAVKYCLPVPVFYFWRKL